LLLEKAGVIVGVAVLSIWVQGNTRVDGGQGTQFQSRVRRHIQRVRRFIGLLRNMLLLRMLLLSERRLLLLVQLLLMLLWLLLLVLMLLLVRIRRSRKLQKVGLFVQMRS